MWRNIPVLLIKRTVSRLSLTAFMVSKRVLPGEIGQMQITVSVTGLDELIRKVNDPALLGEPLRGFFNQSMTILSRNIGALTPVDTAKLRGNVLDISTSVTTDPSPIPLWAQLKPLSNYAIYVEEDTRPHWTSVKNLIGWAHRHNMNPYAIQGKIAKYGTKGKHMFRQGFEQSKDIILGYLKETAIAIETKWGQK